MRQSDSLSILRTPHEVLVNVNDALHAYGDACIDFYCRRIQSLLKGRQIDYLFLRSSAALEHNHNRDYVKLSTRLPAQSFYVRLYPYRGMRHLMHSPYVAHQGWRRLRSMADRRGSHAVAQADDVRRWIEASPCVACPVCDVAPEDPLSEVSSVSGERPVGNVGA